MISACHGALVETLGRQFSLSKSRLVTLAVLVTGIAQARTVNLTHLAGHFPGPASHASAYRRLQRFFQFVRLDMDHVAVLVVHLLHLERPKCLALDRTNWKIGSRDVNILMLAIVTRRFRVPLLWSLIPHQGNSDTAQRIALMRRYLALFPPASIDLLLADREFVGADWMDFLNENSIPFAIRVKESLTLTGHDGLAWSLRSLLRRKRARSAPVFLQGYLGGTSGATRQSVHIAAKRLADGHWLIVATNRQQPRQALNAYRRRWGIECLFADAKSRGLNLEDTHLRDGQKLNGLLAILALAITWAYRCATQLMGPKAIPRKTHGRRSKSWFRIGLDTLRRWLFNDPPKAIQAWCQNTPKCQLSSM